MPSAANGVAINSITKLESAQSTYDFGLSRGIKGFLCLAIIMLSNVIIERRAAFARPAHGFCGRTRMPC